MKRSQIEQCIRDYLTAQGGSALAGDVTAHATAAGFPSSSVRRTADRIVVKHREGNVFRWALPARPVFSASGDAPPERPSMTGRLVSTDRRRPLPGTERTPAPAPRTTPPTSAPKPAVRAPIDPPDVGNRDWAGDYAGWDYPALAAECRRRGIRPWGSELTESECVASLIVYDDGWRPDTHETPKPSRLPY